VAVLVRKAEEQANEPPSGRRGTPAARPEQNAGFVLAPIGKRRLRDSLLRTSSGEGSTQIVLHERFMVFYEPLLEVAVNNPG
jgi:hypothetical protein